MTALEGLRETALPGQPSSPGARCATSTPSATTAS